MESYREEYRDSNSGFYAEEGPPSGGAQAFGLFVAIVMLFMLYSSWRQQHPRRAPESARAPAPAVRLRRQNSTLEDCPICLGDIDHLAQTNCGHCFCATCLLQYWEQGGRRGLVCPTCRSPVNHIHERVVVAPLLSSETAPSSDTTAAGSISESSPLQGGRSTAGPSAAEITKQVDSFNIRFAGPRSVRQVIADAPVLLKHMVGDLARGDTRVVGALLRQTLIGYHFLLVIGLVLMIILPYDALPSKVFGLLGYVDDILSGLFLLAYMTALYRVALLAIAGARNAVAA